MCYHIYVEKRVVQKERRRVRKKDLCGGKRGSRKGGGSARRRRGLYREIFIKITLIKLRNAGSSAKTLTFARRADIIKP